MAQVNWNEVRKLVKERIPHLKKRLQKAFSELSFPVKVHIVSGKAFARVTCWVVYQRRIHYQRQKNEDDLASRIVDLTYHEEKMITDATNQAASIVHHLRMKAYPCPNGCEKGFLAFKIGPAVLPMIRKSPRHSPNYLY